jgi:propanol-preferring alcohol dehydrogenase
MQWCAERRGLGQPNAVGPDADYVVVPERNCLLLPDELSYDDGAMIACIAATGFSSLRKLALNGEDTLIVFGQGPVGLTGTIMGKALGARVIGVDPVAERRALGLALGADDVLDPGEDDFGAAVQELTDGVGADAAFETSGSAAAHQAVLQVLRLGGRAAFVGFGAHGPTTNLSGIIGKELTLMGSFVMPIHYYWDLVDFMLQYDLPAKYQAMITHRFRLEDAGEAFRVAESARAGKVVFEWD